MADDMQQVMNLFVSLLSNLTGSYVVPEGSEKINLHDNLMCEGQFLRDEIVVELPMNIEPKVVSPKTGIYKCGRTIFSILVSVHNMGETQSTEDVLIGETLSLNCSLTLWKQAGEIRSKLKQADTIQQLLDLRNDYPNLPKEEILTIMANRTKEKYGSNIFYCQWNLQVHTGVEDYIRNFAIIISIHVDIPEDVLVEGIEPTELTISTPTASTKITSTTTRIDTSTSIDTSTTKEYDDGRRNISSHFIFILIVIQKVFVFDILD